MSRNRSRKWKNAGFKAPPVKSAPTKWNGSLALSIIDETPIRTAALKDYEKGERQIDAARKDLEAFETGDLPAFSRWEAQTFGSLTIALCSPAALAAFPAVHPSSRLVSRLSLCPDRNADTAFNREFVSLYKKYQAEGAAVLKQENWPIVLADEVAAKQAAK